MRAAVDTPPARAAKTSAVSAGPSLTLAGTLVRSPRRQLHGSPLPLQARVEAFTRCLGISWAPIRYLVASMQAQFRAILVGREGLEPSTDGL